MQNAEIRERMKEAGIYQWQLAEAIGTNEYSFSKQMRHEFSADKKKIILQAIDKLVNERKEKKGA